MDKTNSENNRLAYIFTVETLIRNTTAPRSCVLLM